MPFSPHTYRRIAAKVQAPARAIAAPYTSPPLAELIARIDGALSARKVA